MKIEHIGIWTNQLEAMKEFYCCFFKATPNKKYINAAKGFESYFLSFEEGSRLELMQSAKLSGKTGSQDEMPGIAHFAISVGSAEAVDELTNAIRCANFKVVSEPRTTGDGYYESIVLDPDGNKVEITN